MRRPILAAATAMLLGGVTAHADSAGPVGPTSADAICGRGKKLAAVAEYERAAESYAACAKRFPNDPRAETALSDAILLRLGLSDREEAIRLADEWVKTYGAPRPARAAVIIYAVAASHIEQEEWRRAGEVLAKNERMLAAAPIDLRILTHMAKARVLLHGPKPELADTELAATRALYGKGDVIETEIARAYPDEDEGQRMKRLAKALTAVGDAMVMQADGERVARLSTLRAPAYSGPRTTDAIGRHVQTTVRAWMEQRRAAIESLEVRYHEVTEMRPIPPPKAVIASAGAVAKMWSDFADDIARTVPLDAFPARAQPRSTLPLRARVKALVDEVRAPIVQRQALPAARLCVKLSVMYQYTDERARECDAWLVQNDAEHVHPLSELAPQPRAMTPAWVTDPPRPAATPGAPNRSGSDGGNEVE
jgi:tetratricopeptide (TPR) repeat protein